MIDLTQISIPELEELMSSIPKEIARRKVAQKEALRKELETKAKEMGFTLDELFEKAPKGKGKQVTVAAKYRHPQDATLTWTGRGRQPRWVGEFIAAGGTLEQLIINK